MGKDRRRLMPDLREVAELAARPDRVDAFVDRALEALTETIPYDLAVFFELRGAALEIRRACGALASPSLTGHRVPLASNPQLEKVVRYRKTLILDDTDPSEGDSSLFGGIVDLPREHSRLLVPVVAGEHDLGIMAFDSPGGHHYDRRTIDIANIFGLLTALGLAAARQAERLSEYREILEERNRLLVEEVAGETDASRRLEDLVSRPMRRLVQMAKQVSITDAPVLITGETGTGKEVLARAIHGWSQRTDKPFIQVNCAALPESLIESELFGHKQGAFSGATEDRRGRFRLADGGTLLLDEIGDLPTALQVKLLRVLQEGAFEPVGMDRTVRVDVRVLAATNIDLEEAIEKGTFREDLFYRLQVFPLNVPPLREHHEDIPILVRNIMENIRRRTGRGPWNVSERNMKRMARHDWPGNVRELVNLLERARIAVPLGGPLRIDLGSSRSSKGRQVSQGKWPSLEEHTRNYLEKVLQATRGKIYGEHGAARILNMPPTTLQSRLTRLGISRARFKRADSR